MPRIKLMNNIFLKSVSLLVSLLVVLSVCIVGIVTSAETPEYWDGTKDKNFAGSGSETDPYLIKTASHLAAIVTGNNSGAWTGKYFKLANDIKINDTSKENWKDTAKNWVWADFRFIGTFDGDGHTIDGLYYKGSQRVVGLFSYVGADNNGTYKTTLKNFNMTNAYIESTAADGAGFAAGQASRVAYFDGIYIDDSCEIKSTTLKGAGGVLGQSGYNVFMSNIAMNGKISGNSNVGAFVGTLSSGARLDIKSSYTSADLYAQGVTDRNLATASSAVYVVKKQGTVDAAATLLTLDQMKGENAKTYMTAFSFDFIWETVENDFPRYNPRGDIWDGSWVTDFDSFEGSGTDQDPYIIKNGAQLAYAVAKCGSALANAIHYKLGNDIVLNDTSYEGWEASARGWVQNTSYRFNGEIDGDGHTIEGLYWNASSGGRYGLVAYSGKLASGNDHVAVFKNITFKGASINNSAATSSTSEGAAIVVGQASGETVFENIYIDETCKINAPNVKGVAGLVARGYNENTIAHITINNCVVLADIKGGAHVGAFAGTFWDDYVVITANNSFAVTDKGLIGGAEGSVVLTAVYSSALGSKDTGAVLVDKGAMKGEAAKTNMPELDFDTVYKTVENGYPVIEIRQAPIPLPEGVWDGLKDSNLEGEGTPESPYLIKTPSQLAAIVTSNNGGEWTGKHFKLANDIIINDTSRANWKDYAKNWVWANYRFIGTFDGDGHTIEGLYYNGSQRIMGLFSYVGASDDGSVQTYLKNFKMVSAYIESSAPDGAGFVAGQASKVAYFDGIYIDETCEIKSTTVTGVGGILGKTGYNVFMSNCAMNGKVAGGSNVGAFVGTLSSGAKLDIKSSYTTADLYVQGVTDRNLAAASGGVYVVKKHGTIDAPVKLLTLEQMKGSAAKTNMQTLDFETVFKTVDNYYPDIEIREAPIVPLPDGVWDGTTADSFAGGDGTPYNPYLIENGEQLRLILEKYSTFETSDGVHFKITKDIYLNNVIDGTPVIEASRKKNWLEGYGTAFPAASAANSFNGTLDGGDHTIYGLFVTGVKSAGLFPGISGHAVIKNLALDNLLITGGGGYCGAIAGQAFYSEKSVGTAVISGCSVTNAVIGQDQNIESAGGFIGNTVDGSVLFKNCYSYNLDMSNWESKGIPGGFTGISWGSGTIKFENCYTVGHFVVNSKVVKTEGKGAVICTNVYTDTARPEGSAVEGVTVLTDDQMKGNAAKENLKGFNFEYDWMTVSGGYPTLRDGVGNWENDTTTEPGKVWNGKLAFTYASGIGTKEDPYIIKTGGQLALLANDAINGKTTGKFYKLAADIILNDTTKTNWQDTAHEWFIGGWDQSFKGHLDGDYHTVSGLFLNKTKETFDNESARYGGLFASLGVGAVVEKVGIVNSSLTMTHDTAKRQLGAFAGYIDHYNGDEVDYENYPLIRECFADTTVFLNGNTCGGFIGTAMRPVRVEDSFFTGKVHSVSRGLIGYSKMGYTTDKVLIKNFYAADSAYAVLSNTSYDNMRYENCYSSSAQDTQGVTRLFIDRMCGNNAKQYMTGLDFNKVWVIGGDKETPGLRGFKKSAYNNIMNPADITISFETNCELEVDSITGKAYSKLTLPTLKREGYKFEGWYAYLELDTPFTYDYFPTFNTILYAKWSLNGFEQDFEDYEDSVYDYHEGIEYYRPTTPDYTAKYVRSGAKSMHRIGGTSEYLDFLLFYNEELEIGKTYKMVFYVTTDQANAAIDMSLVHLDWPDVYAANIGVQKIAKAEGLTDGNWVEYTYTFTAKSKWVAIRTEGDASVYFDDFTLYLTDDKPTEEGDVVATPEEKDNNSNLVLIIIIAAVAVVILGAGAVAFIVIKKRKH